MSEPRLHRMREQDGIWTCADCPAAGRSPMELSRIPCVADAIEQPRVGVGEEGVC